LKASLLYQPVNKIPEIVIPGSKSESNRLLILKALYPKITIQNLSNSDDTVSLINGLETEDAIVDVHHAGTAMRFLLAYFASKEGEEKTLTGSLRMQERPIKVLVEALRNLGADISYLKEEGFPPIKVRGKKLLKNTVTLNANVSSQYISALMLIASSLPDGLTINLKGEITSGPYIKMTLDLLKRVGISGNFTSDRIKIEPVKILDKTIVNVESDWSSASYYYSLVALSENMEISLKNYTENSLQGDSELASIYKNLGVKTTFYPVNNSIKLTKTRSLVKHLSLDLNKTPDIAQTIAVTCFGMGLSCELTGLKTLKIKETDRLLALKIELEKLGALIKITDDSLELCTSESIKENTTIETYQDHRMAMAFAPLALITKLTINNPVVVTKSYISYWNDFKKTGVISQIK